uniref:Uncharacterized protein n=1 Tax=Arundo donax TaxID=35708 RepID=A0A0A8Z4G0_ARUDO
MQRTLKLTLYIVKPNLQRLLTTYIRIKEL